MMGISPFFRAFAAPPAVEDRLAGSPDALAGLQRVLRRAHRGASFALAFAIHRTDPHAATVHAAALLHEFAEMLLWCHAPTLALRIRALQDADPTLRSSVAQHGVLGIELAELQQALVAAWRLPSLLAEASQEPQAESDRRAHRRPGVAAGPAHGGRLGQRRPCPTTWPRSRRCSTCRRRRR